MRTFNRAVRWRVSVADPSWGHVITMGVYARSEEKAHRAVRHMVPGGHAVEVECLVPVRASAGLLLAGLDERERRVKVDGRFWRVTRYSDGQISVDQDQAPGVFEERHNSMIPAYIGAELRTVGEAARIGGALGGYYTAVIGRVAIALLHGVVLSAPARYPSEAVNHATAGRHPDGGGGYACVTDPGGVFLSSTEQVSLDIEGNTHQPDRSAFAAARRFVEIVGGPGAAWALCRAEKKAAGPRPRGEVQIAATPACSVVWEHRPAQPFDE